MARKVDAESRVATIRRSIEESQHHLRKVRCHTLLDELGVKRRGSANTAALRALLAKFGIRADPDPGEAGLQAWIHLRLSEDLPEPPPLPVGHRPATDWFDSLMAAPLATEREVESRFASPLFHALGYTDPQEVMGLHLDVFEGVTVKHPEADLVYFADSDHDLKAGNVLVLVECKSPLHSLDEAIGQAHSYALWLKPMYYVVTNGLSLEAYVFRPGPIPDARVIQTSGQRLQDDFDEIYRYLSFESAVRTKNGIQAGAFSSP